MSNVFDAASVSLLMADYAVTDPLNKLHVVGGGLQLVPRNHGTGVTAAFALVTNLTFAPEVVNEQYAFEIVLENPDGRPVELTGKSAESAGKVMRFGQTLQIDEPQFRGAGVPRHALPPRAQVVLYFNTGLPLPAGRTLVWRARIDGDTKPDWALRFFVQAPPTAPVLG